VASYEATDGREGGTLEGRPVVILTRPEPAGQHPKTPVMRIERDARTVAVASAGAPRATRLGHNLTAPPSAPPGRSAGAQLAAAREVYGRKGGSLEWRIAVAPFPSIALKRAGKSGPALEPRSAERK